MSNQKDTPRDAKALYIRLLEAGTTALLAISTYFLIQVAVTMERVTTALHDHEVRISVLEDARENGR